MKKRLVEMIWGELNEDLFSNIAAQIQTTTNSLQPFEVETEDEEDDSTTQDATKPQEDSELDDLFKDLEIEPEGVAKKSSYF